MIQRVVAVKLKPSFRNDETLAQITEQTLEVLPEAHGVRDVRVGRPSDGMTRRSYDFCIFVTFDHQDDVDQYRTDPVHRAYADVFLKPMRDAIHVWNFEVPDA